MAQYELRTNTACSHNTLLVIEHQMYNSSRVGVYNHRTILYNGTNISANSTTVTYCNLGWGSYAISNQLENVKVAISDRKIAMRLTRRPGFINYFRANLISISGSPSFGSAITDMQYSSDTNRNYRYGFNNQENDNEVFEGAYSAEFWEYDSRIGRRFEIDPLQLVEESPYAVLRNSPIWYTDPDGDWAEVKVTRKRENSEGKLVEKQWWQVWYKTVEYKKQIIIHDVKLVLFGIDKDSPEYMKQVEKISITLIDGLEKWNSKQEKLKWKRTWYGKAIRDELGDKIPIVKKTFILETKVDGVEYVKDPTWKNLKGNGGRSDIFYVYPNEVMLKTENSQSHVNFYGSHQVFLNMSQVDGSGEGYVGTWTVAHEYGHVAGMGHTRNGSMMNSGLIYRPYPTYLEIRRIHRKFFNRGKKMKSKY